MKYYIFTLIALFSLNCTAQTFSPEELAVQRFDDRLNNIEKNLNTLQRQFYKNGGKASGKSSYQGSGTSPKIEVRIDAIEEQIRTLTGRLEENQFAISNALQEINKISKDIDFRLGEIENKNTNTVSNTNPQNLSDTPAPQNLIGKMENTTKESTMPLDEAGQYDKAFAYLRNNEYEKAETSLREFIASNKQSHLISNAYYWLGETYYVRQNYEKSAVNFLKGYQEKPKGNKASDNLLKLGMSLGKLNKKNEACTTFDKLLEEFPDAESAIKDKANSQKKSTKCS